MSEPKDRSLLEASGEIVEGFIDAATDSDLLAAFPVFGTAVRFLQARDNMRERAFAAKLKKFVDGLAGPKDKAKMKAKMAADPEEAQKVGETLFLVLERMTDLDKPALLAKLFVAYLDNVISSIELRRLSQALDNAFPEDIRELVWSDDIHPSYKRDWKEYLLTSGLTRAQGEGVLLGTGVSTYYEISPLGQLMRKALAYMPETQWG